MPLSFTDVSGVAGNIDDPRLHHTNADVPQDVAVRTPHATTLEPAFPPRDVRARSVVRHQTAHRLHDGPSQRVETAEDSGRPETTAVPPRARHGGPERRGGTGH